jgi:hypothetical protein
MDCGGAPHGPAAPMAASGHSMNPFERDIRARMAHAEKFGQVPAPFVTDGQDVHSYSAFMLDVVRLTSSEFWAIAPLDVRGAALAIWSYAWRQAPAASVPDDVKVWARVTGLSERRLKLLVQLGGASSPLYGFVKCSDGRLHHPVLAADALNAIQKRQKHQAAAHSRWKLHSAPSGLRSIGEDIRTARNRHD